MVSFDYVTRQNLPQNNYVKKHLPVSKSLNTKVSHPRLKLSRPLNSANGDGSIGQISFSCFSCPKFCPYFPTWFTGPLRFCSR